MHLSDKCKKIELFAQERGRDCMVCHKLMINKEGQK